MMESETQKAFFEKLIIVKRESETEHNGPPFMQQLMSGDIIASGSRQIAESGGPAWRDAGRKTTRCFLRSKDGGRTWKPGPNIHPGRVMDRITGEMFSIGTRNTPMKDDRGKPMTEAWFIRNFEEARKMGRRIVLSRSKDDGRTWREIDITDKFYNYPGAGLAWFIGHGIQLQRGKYKGRLLIPGRYFSGNWEPFDRSSHNVLYYSTGAGWVYDDGDGQTSEIMNADAHNCVIYSDDHGETWHWGGSSQGYAGEACIVELSDGSVYMNNRNHDPETLGYRSWCISRDGGQTFTEFGVDRTLVESRCHASLARYNFPCGDKPGRILFLNPAVHDNVKQDPGPRHSMTIRVSYDDGKTWPVSKCLREGPAGYSDMIVLEDGTILCAFEISESGFPRDEIMLCRFNIEWLEEDTGR